MSKYIKKPVEVDAFQLNSRGLVEEDWFWDAVTRNDIITHNFGKFYPEDVWCEIKTLEGTMIAKTGDYIIRGIAGEIYPCKADIFEKTYSEKNTIATDVAPVVHAHWVYYKSIGGDICSNCGENRPLFVVKYCPHCGAIMDEKSTINENYLSIL